MQLTGSSSRNPPFPSSIPSMARSERMAANEDVRGNCLINGTASLVTEKAATGDASETVLYISVLSRRAREHSYSPNRKKGANGRVIMRSVNAALPRSHRAAGSGDCLYTLERPSTAPLGVLLVTALTNSATTTALAPSVSSSATTRPVETESCFLNKGAAASANPVTTGMTPDFTKDEIRAISSTSATMRKFGNLFHASRVSFSRSGLA